MKKIGIRLLETTLLLTGIAMAMPAAAFEVKGKVKGLKAGEKVYLMKSPEGKAEHKWCTTVAVDSCKVKGDGEFSFKVKNRKYATLWTLKTKGNMIKYFFTADENLEFQGELASFAIRDKETEYGDDHIAMKDVFAIFEDESFNPVKQRMAVEWLKRHGGDDVTPWAASYYSQIDPYLTPEEVGEILAEIPEKKHQNPYYLSLKKWYDTISVLRIGEKFHMPELITESGSKLDESYYKGHPVLIYSCDDPDIGRWYSEFVNAYAGLTEQFPDLRMILVHPTFFKDEANKAIASKLSNHIVDINLAAQKDLDPVSLNVRAGVGSLLLNKDGQIMNVTSNIDRMADALVKNFDPTRVYEINGYVEGCSEGVAELLIYRDDVPTRIDTAVLENGHFYFYGQFDHPVVCYVGIRGHYDFVDAFLENANIQMHVWSEIAYFKGQKYRRIKGTISSSPIGTEFKEAMALESDAEVEAWLKERPSSWAAFNRVALWTDLAEPEVLDKWMKMLDKKFYKYPEYASFQKKLAMKRRISQGSLAPDFKLADPAGKEFSLSEYRGKYVILDFWASWCGPCRKEIPVLKEIWNEFHDKGLEIVSVSIDDNEKAWRLAVEQEKMPWLQLWRNKTNVDQIYFVSTIPHILLIGPDGKIIGQRLRGQALKDELKKYLH